MESQVHQDTLEQKDLKEMPDQKAHKVALDPLEGLVLTEFEDNLDQRANLVFKVSLDYLDKRHVSL